jgi:hypothetical protein
LPSFEVDLKNLGVDLGPFLLAFLEIPNLQRDGSGASETSSESGAVGKPILAMDSATSETTPAEVLS